MTDFRHVLRTLALALSIIAAVLVLCVLWLAAPLMMLVVFTVLGAVVIIGACWDLTRR